MRTSTKIRIESLHYEIIDLIDEGYSNDKEEFNRNKFDRILNELKDIYYKEKDKKQSEHDSHNVSALKETIIQLESITSNKTRDLDELDFSSLIRRASEQ